MTPSQPALQVHFPVTWWQVEWCRQSQLLLHPGPYQPSAQPATNKRITINSQISFIFKSQRQNLERTLTLELKNSWTPNIFLEYLCVAGNKPIRREKTEPQEASYFLVLRSTCVCWSLFWSLHNQHSENVSSIQDFLSLTSIYPSKYPQYFWSTSVSSLFSSKPGCSSCHMKIRFFTFTFPPRSSFWFSRSKYGFLHYK